MRRLGRLPGIFAAATLALAGTALVALAPASPLVASCLGAGSHRTALVVQHGDGSVATRCVSFDTATVTGEQLLDASGLIWYGQTFGSFGKAVCAVDAEPIGYSACPGADYYWAVFVSRGGGSWQLSGIGISSLSLGDGDAEGLRYVPTTGTPAAPPSPEGVCAASVETAASTAASARAPAATAALLSGHAATAAPVAGDSDLSSPASAASTDPVAATDPVAEASFVAVAAATGLEASPQPGPAAPAPDTGSGFDLGLLVAAVAGGGLAGLALIRLAAGRSRRT